MRAIKPVLALFAVLPWLSYADAPTAVQVRKGPAETAGVIQYVTENKR